MSDPASARDGAGGDAASGAKHVGRWPVRRPAGRAKLGHARGRAPAPQRAATQVVDVGGRPPAPVFVDPSGNRRRRLRPVLYVLGVLTAVALLGLWVSQFAGPAQPPRARCAATSAQPAGTAGARAGAPGDAATTRGSASTEPGDAATTRDSASTEPGDPTTTRGSNFSATAAPGPAAPGTTTLEDCRR